MSTTTDKQALSWFQSLRQNDPDEYRNVMAQHEESIPEVKRGMRSHKQKFDLMESLGLGTGSVNVSCG